MFVSRIYKLHTSKKKFIQLSGLTVTYHLTLLKQLLEKYLDEIRYVYSTYFAKIYNRTNELGIKSKTVFDFTYTTWLKKKHDKKSNSMAKKLKVQILEKINFLLKGGKKFMSLNSN